MIEIQKRYSIFKIYELWNGMSLKVHGPLCFTYYRNLEEGIRGRFWFVKSKYYTIENDLTLTEDEIFNGFNKSIRNQIRGVEKNGVECNRNDVDIDLFQIFYNQFAEAKGIEKISLERLKDFGKNLSLSFVCHNKLIYAAHCYLLDRDSKYALLYLSASRRVIDFEVSHADVSKANKYLHFDDMKYFKSLGIKTYSFGGFSYNTMDHPLYGINRFKRSFGGKVVMKQSLITAPYFILKKMISIFQKWSMIMKNR